MNAMSHVMIVGPSLSGKSVAAKEITRHAGREVLVYDRQAGKQGKGVNGWRGLVFTNWDTFVRCVWQKRGCIIVIDDAAKVFRDKQQNKEALRMLEEGRHMGHLCIVMAQRYTGISKSARDNCDDLIVFRCNYKDADELALQFANPAIKEAAKLPRYVFLHCRQFEPPKKGKAKLKE